jgi:mitochondrial fission protein ELM1
MTQAPLIPVPSCWILTDGNVGTMNQCLGLTEALGVSPSIRLSRPRAPWRWLAPAMWPWPLAAQPKSADSFAPPWPDLLIASGRTSFAPAAAIRRRAGEKTVLVAIQHPRTPLNWFDLVIIPAHDRVSGPNVLSTEGALNRVSPAALAKGKAEFEPVYAALPRPLIAVLLGGSNHRYSFDADVGARLGAELAAVAKANGAGLALTASRRTDPEALAALMAALRDVPHDLWSGEGANPYMGLLALSDHIVATEDSVSMVSEALMTGKPVHVAKLKAKGKGKGGKFADLHQRFVDQGRTRPFAPGPAGALPHWTYAPLNDTMTAATRVAALLTRGKEKAA